MTLDKYNNSLFNKLSDWISIDYDKDSWMYCLINNETPWVFWVWEAIDLAIWEYLSWFWDLILINQKEKNEVETIA